MRLLLAVVGGVLPVVAAWSLGRVVLGRLRLPVMFELAAGTALLSLLLFALFLTHLAHPWVFIALAVAGITALALLPGRAEALVRAGSSALPQLPGPPSPHSSTSDESPTLPAAVRGGPPSKAPVLLSTRIPLWVWPAVIIYSGLYLAYAFTPEIQSDALHYHLWLASQTQTSGGFPESISFYSVLPQGMETLFAFAFALGGEPAAKLLHLLFLIASVPVLLSIAQKLGYPPETGWMAGLFFAATPVVGISATCAYTDAALVFYTLAVFALLLEWWSKPGAALALVAGLCAGFCYAIKFTGGWTAVLACCVIVSRRKWPQTILFAAGVLAVAGPWIVRAAVLTGNPFAPLLNSSFPNPWFHLETINGLSKYLRDYGGVSWTAIPWQLTVRGDLLQGILGPLCLLLPLSLLAVRNRGRRILLAAALLSAIPWTLNIGTRFLLPALPFLVLAMIGSLPRAVGASVLVLHLIASWPTVIPLYAPPGIWALDKEIPWRVAAGLEDAAAWRNSRSIEIPIVNLIQAHTSERDRILDLVNVPIATTQRELVNVWQSAAGDRILHELELARTPGGGQFYQWRSQFAAKKLARVRVRFTAGRPNATTIREVTFLRPDGALLSPTIVWTIEAWPNIWEAALAVDRNRASGWSTWQPVEPGMFWQVDFNGAPQLSEVIVVADNSAVGARLQIWGDEGGWRELPLSPARPVAPLNLRLAAMRMARRDGVTHVVAQRGLEGSADVLGKIGQALEEDARDWGLQAVARQDNVVLYRMLSATR